MTAQIIDFGECGAVSSTKNPIEGTWAISSATLAATRCRSLRSTTRSSGSMPVVLRGTTPAAIDTHGRDGPNAGHASLAIYDLKGEALTVCYDLSGKARPTAFVFLPWHAAFPRPLPPPSEL